MKRLIKNSGLAMDKVNRMPGDIVTVYHGTTAAYIESILSNGLSENLQNSYQFNGVNYNLGIWVTLSYNVALQYAKDATFGFTNNNKNSNDEELKQYFNYGAILEINIPKNMLTDIGSSSNNNLKSKDIITSDMIKHIYIIDFINNKTLNYF